MKKHNFFFRAYDLNNNHTFGFTHVLTTDDIWKVITEKYLDNSEYQEFFIKDPYGAIYHFDIKQYLKIEFPYIIKLLQEDVNNHLKEDEALVIDVDTTVGVCMDTEMHYRSYDKEYNNECTFVEGLHKDIDRIDKHTEISVSLLQAAGFENITMLQEAEFWATSEYAIKDFSEWRKDTSDIDGCNYVIITMRKGVTNNGAKWGVHIDNYLCESIGSADITNVRQFNMLMQILESKYRL